MMDFARQFQLLTGNTPFPWQSSLFQRFVQADIPPSCCIPTGLGKTNVIAIWLIALAHGLPVPRRLVYVVNRRTVVDQTTEEAKQLRDHAPQIGIHDLAISTLRGQYADNQEWSENPSRPAIICGTVDMIGSRLLFSGYGIGMKGRPLHAGFLGQDVLLIHDEAHLEPAFQDLIEKIQEEQQREKAVPWPKLQLMELTATSRGQGEPFTLTPEDNVDETVSQRINAVKKLHLEPLRDPKKLAEQIKEKARTFESKPCTVLIFARTVEDVRKIAEKLPSSRVLTLTGTMRGQERDQLVEQPLFKRFLPGGSHDGECTWLVCTSAGEVGVNISADHLVCDLSTFDSMAQRFGRVNRFGKRNDTEIHVIHPTAFDQEKPLETRRAKTLYLLQQLNGDASPSALGQLDSKERQEAFALLPTILPVTDMLFDAWSLTTIQGKLPGRPSVEPYLHGITDDPLIPETQVAWRKEVEVLKSEELLGKYPPADLLEVYPLKPHELLKEPSYRVIKQLEVLAKRLDKSPPNVWLLDDTGEVEVVQLKDLIGKDNKNRIQWKTVILPPSAGGLREGMLSGDEPTANDIADEWEDQAGKRLRCRINEGEPVPDEMRLVQRIDTHSDEPGEDESDAAKGQVWLWFVKRNEGGSTARKPVLWDVHVRDVEQEATRILDGLKDLPSELRRVVEVAARFHDHGKRRKLFQNMLGNRNSATCWAKSGKNRSQLQEPYRHEFASLLDVVKESEFKLLSEDQKDLVLHLIAAHHGRARPHFPAVEVFDPEGTDREAEDVAAETPRRFARLQRKFGRWGLAYLESILRAADWAASAKPSAYVEGDE